MTLTFLVVMCFLGPICGYGPMLSEHNFYLHLVGPLLAMLTCALEGPGKISFRQSLLGLIPMMIYALVYLTMVIIIEKWSDFYSFNLGGLWPVTFAVIILVTFLIGLGLRALHNRFAR